MIEGKYEKHRQSIKKELVKEFEWLNDYQLAFFDEKLVSAMEFCSTELAQGLRERIEDSKRGSYSKKSAEFNLGRQAGLMEAITIVNTIELLSLTPAHEFQGRHYEDEPEEEEEEEEETE